MNALCAMSGSAMDRSERLRRAEREVSAPALLRLSDGLRAVRPLAKARNGNLRLFAAESAQASGTTDTCSELFEEDRAFVNGLLTSHAQEWGFVLQPAFASAMPAPTAVDLAATGRIGLQASALLTLRSTTDLELARSKAIQLVRDATLEGALERRELELDDGAVVPIYRGGGGEGRRAVVAVLPCGIPVDLCEVWLLELLRDFHVVTWETRSLFSGARTETDLRYDVERQAADLISVMDACEVRSAHVMAFCGGAVIGMEAAASYPERVDSLSLWHGDFSGVRETRARTVHQQDLRELFQAAAASLENAAMLQEAFLQPTVLQNMPAELAHLLIYPFATAELFHRYALLNGDIMTRDPLPAARAIRVPTLVVSSRGDTTAHPDGSLYVSEELRSGRLHMASSGDHLSVFSTRAHELVTYARAFMTGTRP